MRHHADITPALCSVAATISKIWVFIFLLAFYSFTNMKKYLQLRL